MLFQRSLGQTLEARLSATESALTTNLDARALTIGVRVLEQSETTLTTAVTFTPQKAGPPNGQDPGLFDLIYAFYDSRGGRLQAGKRDEIQGSGASSDPQIVKQKQPLPPGAVKLRVAVRNAASGAIGSATVALRQ